MMMMIVYIVKQSKELNTLNGILRVCLRKECETSSIGIWLKINLIKQVKTIFKLNLIDLQNKSNLIKKQIGCFLSIN